MFAILFGVGTAHAATGDRLFFDDFSDQTASQWTPSVGSWSVESGIIGTNEYVARDPRQNQTFVNVDTSSWSDYTVQADISPETSDISDSYGLIARAQDSTHYYELLVQNQDGGGHGVSIYKISGDTSNRNNIKQLNTGAFKVDGDRTTPYLTLRFEVIGNTLTGFASINGGQSFTQLLSANDTDYTGGGIGLSAGSFGPGNVPIRKPAEFGNVRVTEGSVTQDGITQHSVTKH